jgi:hypothetical protein
MKLEIKNKNENETVTGPDHKQTTVHVLSKGKKQGLKKKNKYKVTFNRCRPLFINFIKHAFRVWLNLSFQFTC